jgi:hypothetical protein
MDAIKKELKLMKDELANKKTLENDIMAHVSGKISTMMPGSKNDASTCN